MQTAHTQRLLKRTGRRMHLARVGAAFHRGWLIAAGAVFTALLGARLLALWPAELIVQWLWLPAALAAGVAVAAARKPRPADAARLVDEHTGSKDLFLTTALLAEGASPATYSPIVVGQAEERAQSIDPRRVVSFSWQRGARDVALSGALVAALVVWLPQFDPLKKNEQRDKVARQEQHLEQTKKATESRMEEIRSGDAEQAEKVKQALAALEKTFKEAKPHEREANLKRLGEHLKEIGAMWRQAADQRRPETLDQGGQRFGQSNPQQTQQWREQLKKGETAEISKEIESIRSGMQKLAQQPDSAEKRAQQEEIAQRLSRLNEAMKQAATSSQMQAALERAMEQLDMSKTGEMSKEALEAAQQSMSLSQQELEQLAQSMKDQQNLEDALKNLQMARQLADQEKLDGAQCQNFGGMSDYEALYKKMLEQSGAGSGPGMGTAAGQGAGGKADENDEAETGFKKERSPTQLSAGKTLLQWKTQELGPKGERPEEYQEAMKQVKQGVSEAIAAERVPPGYQDVIRKYFDSLPAK